MRDAGLGILVSKDRRERSDGVGAERFANACAHRRAHARMHIHI